jgi:ribosome-binding factor A
MADTGDKRTSRVEREIREIVAQFIIRGLRVKPSGLLTVSRTWVSKDLQIARIYFTVLGGTETPAQVEEILEKSLPDMQREVARNLQTKYCPKLEIFHDDGYEKAMKVQGLLREIELENEQKKKKRTFRADIYSDKSADPADDEDDEPEDNYDEPEDTDPTDV